MLAALGIGAVTRNPGAGVSAMALSSGAGEWGSIIVDALRDAAKARNIPFTPETAALALPDTKSVSPDDLSPAQTATPTEIYYLVKGPGLPTAGLLCQRVKDGLDKPFRYSVTVKSLGRKAT